MEYLKNPSIGSPQTFYVDGYECEEMIRQVYGGNNCVFSAGVIHDHPEEHVYLKWQKDGDDGSTLLLKKDELAAIAWIATGTLWSVLMTERNENGAH